jgi:50S ribosomal subunit-associated GTPase HflX
MNELVERISEFVARGTMTVELRVPASRADLIAKLHREGTVHDVRYDADFSRVVATIPTRSLEIFAEFLPEPSSPEAVPTRTE